MTPTFFAFDIAAAFFDAGVITSKRGILIIFTSEAKARAEAVLQATTMTLTFS